MGYGEEFVIKGFIDDNVNALEEFEGYPPMLGSIEEYCPEEDDVFTVNQATFAVCHLALVKRLVEQVEDIRVRC